MSFGFGVGDIILVSQISWKVWHACSSGRKAAPGQFRELEDELWVLSITLEKLAASSIEASEAFNKDCQDLEHSVRLCEATILELDAILEKYRPAFTKKEGLLLQPDHEPGSPGKSKTARPGLAETGPGLLAKAWTGKAKQTWRQLIWANEKDRVNAVRSRVRFHLQVLSTFCDRLTLQSNLQLRQKLDALEANVESSVKDLSKLRLSHKTSSSDVASPVGGINASKYRPTEDISRNMRLESCISKWLSAFRSYINGVKRTETELQRLHETLIFAKSAETPPPGKESNNDMPMCDPVRLLKVITVRSEPDISQSTDDETPNLSRQRQAVHSLQAKAVHSALDSVAQSVLAGLSSSLCHNQLTLQLRVLANALTVEDAEVTQYCKQLTTSIAQSYMCLLAEILSAFSDIVDILDKSSQSIYPAFLTQFLANNMPDYEAIHSAYCVYRATQSASAALPEFEEMEPNIFETVQAMTLETLDACNVRRRTPTQSKRLQALRSWLEPCDDIEDEMAIQRSRKWPGTCNWVFKKRSYCDWFENQGSNILWIHGRPGAGKSILASHIATAFEEAGELVAYFCFRYNNENLRSPKALMRSIAWQIACVNDDVSSAYADVQSLGLVLAESKTGLLWKRLFADVLFSIKLANPVYWIIDALDECDPIERIAFLNFVGEISRSKTQVKIIFLSRYLRDIATKFRQSPVPVDEITPEDSIEDIQTFVTDRLNRSDMAEYLKQEILTEIVKSSKGTFLWVSKTLDELDLQDTEEDMVQAVKQLPYDLEQLYSRILGDMAKLPKSQKDIARTILTWTVAAARPLLLPEIVEVLCSAHGKLSNGESAIRNTCGQLVSIDRKQRVQANHMTIPEYLQRDDIGLEFCIDTGAVNKSAAIFCLAYLHRLDHEAVGPSQMLTQFCFANYATLHWAVHVEKAPFSEDVSDTLCNFLHSTAFASWLQTLADLAELKSALRTVDRVERYLLGHPVDEIGQLLLNLRKMLSFLGFDRYQYDGETLNGNRHGLGVCHYPNGDRYEGSWEDDMRHGFGECWYMDGRYYAGRWSQDEFNGQGSLRFPDGSQYVGEWVAGKKSGYGAMEWTTMERFSYRGHWMNDRPHGIGKMIFCWGTCYEGEWDQGREHGMGKMVYWNGNHFTGLFEDGDETGDLETSQPLVEATLPNEVGRPSKARLRYSSGGIYEGDISYEGLPHGHGVLLASTGVRWKGSFANGKFHGAGVSTRPDGGMLRGTWTHQAATGLFEDISGIAQGSYYKGNFKDTTRDGQGIWRTPFGYTDEGSFFRNEMHGSGQRYFDNGDKYEGTFANGSLHGDGCLVYSCGTSYEGQWRNDKKDGYGKLRLANGVVFNGQWRNNVAMKGQFDRSDFTCGSLTIHQA